jgi:glutamate/tyrosine decarboxylase-like PLP-dependent enzyme
LGVLEEYMDEKYNEWMNKSQEWKDKLERALNEHGGNDVVTEYTNVAFAFPSNEPNPYSFDYPLIDQDHFINWAKSKGWKVQLATENASEKSKHRPPVRFTKI